MLRLVMVLILAVSTAPAGRAQDNPPSKAAAQLEALRKEHAQAQDQHRDWRQLLESLDKEVRNAKTEEERKAASKKLEAVEANNPAVKFATRFLDLAVTHARTPEAFEALALSLSIGGAATIKSGVRGKVIDNLRLNYADKPEIKKVLRQALLIGDRGAEKLVTEVLARNSDRRIQGLACKQLASGMRNSLDLAVSLQEDDEKRESFERVFGKEYVDTLLGRIGTMRKEAARLDRLVKEKYADHFPDLTIGKKAPEVVSQDLQGKEVKLSSLKGKVVVLDVWTTGCGPCRAMIPHQRALVEKLKTRPFVLVSISADDRKEVVTQFLARTPMPWSHWWNGSEGGILEDWGIDAFPTIYVLDGQGVIRSRNVRGEALEDAVLGLLKELESAKGK